MPPSRPNPTDPPPANRLRVGECVVDVSLREVVRADGVSIRVVAGVVDGTPGAVREIAADPTYLDVAVPPHASLTLPCPRGHTAFAYVFEGEGTFDAEVVSQTRLVVFGDGDTVEVHTAADSVRFLLVSGKPLHEPIARYGPFVMNTRAEIEQTLRDLRNGTFIQP